MPWPIPEGRIKFPRALLPKVHDAQRPIRFRHFVAYQVAFQSDDQVAMARIDRECAEELGRAEAEVLESEGQRWMPWA